MSKEKKKIRENFRKSVFIRDRFSCVICGLKADKNDPELVLDAHHITNRNKMPSGGYVKENGISLCKDKCHLLAEEVEQGISQHEGFEPEELYKLIGSSFERAVLASQKL